MQRRDISFWVFLLPALVAFFFVIVVPFFLGAYYSFTDWDGIRVSAFVGFDNFKKLFAQDPRFLYSIIITCIYSVANILALNCVALALALLVTQKLRLQHLYRMGFFLPNLIGGLILGYVWQFIFNKVVPAVFDENFLMLSTRNTALLAIVITGTWQGAGYLMMIYVTAIGNIPRSVLEAAAIDGATAFKRMWHIILPFLTPAFTITTFLTLMNSFKQFDVNYSLTGGGPAVLFGGKAINGTEFIAMNIYNDALTGGNMELAQTKSLVFFLALVLFSLLQVYINKKRELEL